MEIQLIRSIFLLRHGQEARGTDDRLGGTLTDLGRAQAERAGIQLSNYPIQSIYASTLHRAAETAKVVAQHLPSAQLELTDELWECAPILPKQYGEHLLRQNQTQVVVDQERCDRLFERYFSAQEGETILLVGHGNLIRYLVCRLLGLPSEAWLRFDMNNCGICRVDWKTVLGQQLTGFNDVGHLLPELVTYG